MSTPEMPSTIAWWVLVSRAKRSLLQPLHQPQLPERLAAVELLREDPRGEPLQLLLAARLGQRRMADVVGQVEVDVVGPERPPGLQRRHDEALAEARHLAQPAAHVLDQIDVFGRRPLEDQDRADVHVAVEVSLVRNEASTAVSRSRWCPCVAIPQG